MKHKPESWNSATSESQVGSQVGVQPGVRRSLSFTRARAGLQLGQLSHLVSGVSGALSAMPGSGRNPRGAAQLRMRELLNQDRALLSHRACGSALWMDDDEEGARDDSGVPVKGGKSRGAAQSRMRELLNQDRALLALRRSERADWAELDGDDPAPATSSSGSARVVSEALAAPAAELDRGQAPAGVFCGATATVPRGTCVGATLALEAPIALVPSEPAAPAQVSAAAPAAATTPPERFKPADEPEVAVTPQSAASSAVPATALAPAAKPGATATATASEGDGADPIRTRSMAKLLAMQGYKDRALSIYEELLAEPDNADLRAEADKLRAK